MPSNYGREVCEHIIPQLSGYPVIIVSGLALGIDSLALELAVKHNIPAIAFPGSGLGDDVIYPASRRGLALRILEAGGALISEYSDDFKATDWSFPQRNRLMAGISDLLLIIEAKERSGTLITAKYALDFNRDIAVIPGPIFSELSVGTNKLIKDGAYPVNSAEEILELLNIEVRENVEQNISLSDKEKYVLDEIGSVINKEILIEKINLPINEISQNLMSLLLKGLIREIDGEIYRIE
jgi:DNA processing protein